MVNLDSLPAKMVLGATGGMGAAIFCHPLDVIRVTMQVSSKKQNTFTVAMDVFKESGLRRGLYAGLSAAFLRQWTFGSCRIGIYSFLLSNQAKPSEVGFATKTAFGLFSGCIGSIAGTPAELALTRMSADAKLPLAERRGLGVHKILAAVIKEDGFFGMWRGVGPTVGRAMVVSASTLAITSEAKQMLTKYDPVFAQEYPQLTMATSTFIASFWATLFAQPLSVVQARLMNMKVVEGAEPPYSGAIDCAAKCFRQGPLTLMRGFTPAFVKLTPYTMISLMLVEKLTTLLTGKSAL